MLQFTGRAGAFCLKYQTNDPYVILQQIYTAQAFTLSFNSFVLETLPTEAGLFVDAERLVLSHNQFADVPDSLVNLTQLQSIELEATPLTPYFKGQAASDDDFTAYRQDPDFMALIKE